MQPRGLHCVRPLARTGDLLLRSGQKTFALCLLARQLAGPADRIGLLARALFRGLLIGAACPHFPEEAFALHLLLQYAKRLLDVVVPDEYLQSISLRSQCCRFLILIADGLPREDLSAG